MSRRPLALGVLALLAAAPLVAQQPVLLRLNPRKGQTNHYRAVIETYMQGGPMAAMSADTTQPFQRTTLFQTRTCTDIIADTLVFSEVIDSARIEMPAMPQAAQFAGAMAARMSGMTTTTKMDRRAHIYDTEVTGGPAAMAGAQAGRGGPGGGQGSGRGAGSGSSSRNMVYILPANPVRPGDSWSDSMEIRSDSGQNSTFRATFRLERVEGQVATISMNGSVDMSVQGTATTMTTSGQLQLDLGQGRLGGMQMTMAGSMPTRMGTVPMRMVMTTQRQP